MFCSCHPIIALSLTLAISPRITTNPILCLHHRPALRIYDSHLALQSLDPIRPVFNHHSPGNRDYAFVGSQENELPFTSIAQLFYVAHLPQCWLSYSFDPSLSGCRLQPHWVIDIAVPYPHALPSCLTGLGCNQLNRLLLPDRRLFVPASFGSLQGVLFCLVNLKRHPLRSLPSCISPYSRHTAYTSNLPRKSPKVGSACVCKAAAILHSACYSNTVELEKRRDRISATHLHSALINSSHLQPACAVYLRLRLHR